MATVLAMTVDDAAHVLRRASLPVPVPGPGQVLLRVRCCGVCRTDLHVVHGELPAHKPGVVPGHEIVGEVVGAGTGCGRLRVGDRVGVPWLAHTCGRCMHCLAGRENLCEQAQYTGWDRDGGFAEYTVADEAYCLALPDGIPDEDVAPLLCAGLIGWRSWKLAGGAGVHRLGLWGFGAAAHLLCQLAVSQGQEVYAFTRPGEEGVQRFARNLGAAWAGGSDERPPVPLDASILFAPDGALVPAALATVRPGGFVVCGGIHMSPIPSFPYSLLWGERQLRSVANLTRADGEEYLALVAARPVQAHVEQFALADAPEALKALHGGHIRGAAVLVPAAG